ncbi:MAG: hypothetical protein WAK00_01385 [Microbacterium sp.]|uniref:hypothetical protein n=1 Tax=Microbacterium sp. TaxID=51671 RepID=UPI003BB0900C
MTENMERTPHPEDPAEGATGVGGPEHNTAPDGYAPEEEDLDAESQQATPGGDARSALGGDQGTEDQLDADNPTERDTLKTLDPDDSPA